MPKNKKKNKKQEVGEESKAPVTAVETAAEANDEPKVDVQAKTEEAVAPIAGEMAQMMEAMNLKGSMNDKSLTQDQLIKMLSQQRSGDSEHKKQHAFWNTQPVVQT